MEVVHKDIQVGEIHLPGGVVRHGEALHPEPEITDYKVTGGEEIAPGERCVILGGRHTEYPLEVGCGFSKGIRLHDQEEAGVVQTGVAEVCPGAAYKAQKGELGSKGSYCGNCIGTWNSRFTVYDGYIVKGDGLEGAEGYHLEGDIGIHAVTEILHNLAAHPGLDPGGLHGRKRRQEY